MATPQKDGSGGWTQAVPLIRFTVQPNPKFSLTAGGKTEALAETKQIMAWTQRPTDRVEIRERAPGLRQGYGVTAPERGWEATTRASICTARSPWC